MILYMIKSSGGNYLKSYQQNENDIFTAIWTGTAAKGTVFFDWKTVSDIASKVGGTVLKFKLES